MEHLSSAESAQTVQAVGLRYMTDTAPGIRRKRVGQHFSYLDKDNQPIHDPEELARIKALAIPPAYTDVWICPSPNGYLQATGRDARGRKQYRYHPRWREVRAETKYSRMIAFGKALPCIRAHVEVDLAHSGLSREKVLATVVRLLETTLIRVGNEEYARVNKSFGLTTLRNRHVTIEGATLHFHFRGKSGITHTIALKDRRLARIVACCRELPGYELFQYLDENGARQKISSEDVNNYLHQITGEDFTAKDFRTWAGTVLAAITLQEFENADSEAQAKKNVVQAIEAVAQRLGNTPTICRKCYVHPVILDTYLAGTLCDALRRQGSQKPDELLLLSGEAAVLALLEQHLSA